MMGIRNDVITALSPLLTNHVATEAEIRALAIQAVPFDKYDEITAPIAKAIDDLLLLNGNPTETELEAAAQAAKDEIVHTISQDIAQQLFVRAFTQDLLSLFGLATNGVNEYISMNTAALVQDLADAKTALAGNPTDQALIDAVNAAQDALDDAMDTYILATAKNEASVAQLNAKFPGAEEIIMNVINSIMPNEANAKSAGDAGKDVISEVAAGTLSLTDTVNHAFAQIIEIAVNDHIKDMIGKTRIVTEDPDGTPNSGDEVISEIGTIHH